MPSLTPSAAIPRGIIHVPVTPFTADNKVDLDTFARVIEFLLKHDASSLCVNLHLAESLNLTMDERKLLAKTAVEVVRKRVPVIVHVSMPGTDQAIDLARDAEKNGADVITAIAPATLIKLMERFPNFVGLKEASHNWEKYLELGRAARSVRPEFGLFVGTEWMIPCLTLGGTACMSVFGGISPRFVKSLYDATTAGRLKEALELQYKFSDLYQINKIEYPAPTKAMWEIMGRPVGKPRLPNRPLTAERKKEIKGTLERLGLFDSEPHGW